MRFLLTLILVAWAMPAGAQISPQLGPFAVVDSTESSAEKEAHNACTTVGSNPTLSAIQSVGAETLPTVLRRIQLEKRRRPDRSEGCWGRVGLLTGSITTVAHRAPSRRDDS